VATAVARAGVETRPARTLPGRRYDHVFFPGMALLILVTVFVGFARTYYLAGVFRAPLPAPIIHVHAVLFTSWILLLVTQTSLVSAGRVAVHMRMGIAGFVLACLMVLVGVLAATNSLVRGFGGGPGDAKFFYIIPLTDMLIFATLVAFAYGARSNPPAHKRLILVATIALLIAAIARWPFVVVHQKPLMAALFSYAFLAALAAYDLWSTRKIQRATLWAAAFLIFVQQVRVPIGQTATWHAFAGWVQSIAR